ncbi:MAG: diguanylate cyclase [Gammaproteobacteria bacterium]|nr:diguanylate cyclase [Gammaproteobacteria bacterium]
MPAEINQTGRYDYPCGRIKTLNETVLPSLTVSIGMAEMQGNDTAEQLIHAADKAMYRAKRAGKNIIKS